MKQILSLCFNTWKTLSGKHCQDCYAVRLSQFTTRGEIKKKGVVSWRSKAITDRSRSLTERFSLWFIEWSTAVPLIRSNEALPFYVSCSSVEGKGSKKKSCAPGTSSVQICVFVRCHVQCRWGHAWFLSSVLRFDERYIVGAVCRKESVPSPTLLVSKREKKNYLYPFRRDWHCH